MDNFSYYAPTQYLFGKGVEEQAGPISRKWLGQKIMIVSGHGSARRSGLLDRIETSLRNAGVKFILHEGINPNPVDTPVYDGIDKCRREGVTGLLAVGGGSVIDTAKAIAAGVPYPGDFWDFWSGTAVMETALPVGVVLTIPAAGSEGSGNSVITSTRNGVSRKISLRTDSALRPKFALLNPELTISLPPEQTAAGAADMLAHIMERYFSPTPDVETTDRVAEGVMTAILNTAPRVIAHPADYQARANLMWAGTLAHNGVCGCGRKEDWASHALEHEMSALYGVTHGAGLAVVFPAWITFMAHEAPAKPAQWAHRVMGVAPTTDAKADALEGVKRLKLFFRQLNLPVTMKELGIDNPDIATMVKHLHENKGEVIGGYRPLRATDTEAIYRLML